MHCQAFILIFLTTVLLSESTLKASDASSPTKKPHSPEKEIQIVSTSAQTHQQHSMSTVQHVPIHRDRNLAFQRIYQRLNEKIEKAKTESEKRKEAGQARKTDLDLEQNFKRLKIAKD